VTRGQDVARGIHKLSARRVETAKPGGKVRYIPDGGGLYLRLGAKWGRSWVYRYREGTKLHELGLGSALKVGLVMARKRASEIREQRGQGTDPLVARRKHVPTFGEIADRYIADHRGGWAPRHAVEWESTLAKLSLRPMRADRIGTPEVLASVAEHWAASSAQSRRVLERIRIVLDAAGAAGHRDPTVPNPSRWRGHLQHLQPSLEASAHHKAMPWKEVPAFFARLRECNDLAARALELIILTIARAGDVLGEYGGKGPVTWAEVDFDRRVWTVPGRAEGRRMKSGRPHEVPLATQTVELLAALPEPHTGLIFPGLHAKSCLNLLRNRLGVPDYVVHGFRGSFGSWCQEHDVPWDLRELALAHTIGGRVEQAYLRENLLERRRQLAEAWAHYCDGAEPAESKVVRVAGRAG
jgi:integrase